MRKVKTSLPLLKMAVLVALTTKETSQGAPGVATSCGRFCCGPHVAAPTRLLTSGL